MDTRTGLPIVGMVGGGQGAFIGGVHRIAARLDDRYELVARHAGMLLARGQVDRRGEVVHVRVSHLERLDLPAETQRQGMEQPLLVRSRDFH